MATPYSPYDPAAAAAAQRMALMGKLAGEAPEAVPGAGGVDPSYGVPSFRTAPPFSPGGVPASGDTGIVGPIQPFSPTGPSLANDVIMKEMPGPAPAPAPPAVPGVAPQPWQQGPEYEAWKAKAMQNRPPGAEWTPGGWQSPGPPADLKAAQLPMFSEPPPPGATDTPGGPIDAPTGGVIGPGAGVIPPDAGAFAPPKPGGPVTLGPFTNKLGAVNSQKLNDPNHQTPKYQILRTLTHFDPANGVPIDALNQLGLGTFTQVGKDKVRITNGDPRFEGVTEIDMIVDSDNAAGKRHWAFQTGTGGGGGKDAGAGGGTGGLPSLLGTNALGNVNANIDQFMQGMGANERSELMKLLAQSGMGVGAQLKQPQPAPKG